MHILFTEFMENKMKLPKREHVEDVIELVEVDISIRKDVINGFPPYKLLLKIEHSEQGGRFLREKGAFLTELPERYSGGYTASLASTGASVIPCRSLTTITIFFFSVTEIRYTFRKWNELLQDVKLALDETYADAEKTLGLFQKIVHAEVEAKMVSKEMLYTGARWGFALHKKK